jgi:hypothetical protein
MQVSQRQVASSTGSSPIQTDSTSVPPSPFTGADYNGVEGILEESELEVAKLEEEDEEEGNEKENLEIDDVDPYY